MTAPAAGQPPTEGDRPPGEPTARFSPPPGGEGATEVLDPAPSSPPSGGEGRPAAQQQKQQQGASGSGRGTAPNDLPATESTPEKDAAFPPLPEDAPWPVVPGYQILHLLGTGSFGRVYKARETASGKTVAIKFFTHGPGARWQALLEEVSHHARLDAVRGIVDLKRVVADHEPPYYVMAYADRGSLADLLTKKGKLPVAQALEMFRQAAEALAYVHAKGICHCDLKPGNILLDVRGQVLLADFGQAQPASSEDGSAALGTLFYMSPEQADLHSPLPDPGWDVYALGAVLYTMLTGERPRYHPNIHAEMDRCRDLGQRLECYRRWLREQAPAPTAHRGVADADLAQIIDRCLELDPRKRLRDAGAVLTALERREKRRKRRPLLILGLAGSLLALALTAFAAHRNKQEAIDIYQRDLTGQLVKSNRSSASLIARTFELQLSRRKERVMRAAQEPALSAATRANDRPTLERHLRRLMSSDDRPAQRFAEATVTSQKGVLMAMVRLVTTGGADDAARRLVAEDVDAIHARSRFSHFSWRDWFSGQGDRFDATQEHHPPVERLHVSAPYLSSLDPDGLFVSLSAPVRDPAAAGDGTKKAKPIGVLEAAIHLSELSRWLRDAHIGQGGFAVVLDSRGHCLLHRGNDHRPEMGQPARRFFDAQEMGRLFRDAGGVLTDYRDPVDDREYLAGYARLSDEELGWLVLVQHERASVLGPIRGLRERLTWIGAQMFAVVVLVMTGLWGWLFWLLRRLDQPAAALGT